MYYTIYKITNQINGKHYIGSHKTKNLDDDYMGSGKYLRHAQRKYGLENFKKEILHVFDNAEDMYSKEAEIVNENFIAEANTYNVKVGGFGGFDYINDRGLNGAKKGAERTKILMQDPVFYNKWLNAKMEGYSKISDTKKELISKKRKETIRNKFPNGLPASFKGRSHSIESRKKIGEKNSIHQKGSGNSQYGKRWIHSTELKVSKRIEKNDPLPDGWFEGRKMKF